MGNFAQDVMPNRIAAVSAAVAVLTAAALLNLFERAGEQARQGDPYAIQRQIDRLRPVLQELPPSAKVGYLSDLDTADTRGLLAFDAARYALAPRLLAPAAGVDPGGLVLGNFSAPRDFSEAGARAGLTLQKDFGNGVVLYRKAAR